MPPDRITDPVAAVLAAVRDPDVRNWLEGILRRGESASSGTTQTDPRRGEEVGQKKLNRVRN
jgi:hypothetical protein